eukprot:6171572-Amphidinium_carterae.1
MGMTALATAVSAMTASIAGLTYVGSDRGHLMYSASPLPQISCGFEIHPRVSDGSQVPDAGTGCHIGAPVADEQRQVFVRNEHHDKAVGAEVDMELVVAALKIMSYNCLSLQDPDQNKATN